ncbi:DUF4145 domain-containing protein [Vibrio parahaemolyticus]|uniref:DUF4145 domain-containing protein n=2 Tax=Vibrionaceae TaxID=641 RepID=UPI001A8ED134|nr:MULTISPECIES: DUF4145 domain-containing protein [Vibrio]EGQ7973477.1 DUF4145 domain-containing protein [Vibrio parahaemolyticus]MBO0208621.1 DUF4145 domain-containing protein [Vibrio sp. Vb0877]MCR9810916.1 DUF4145 domain-containing protein [Vibrio parahaemolyticus]
MNDSITDLELSFIVSTEVGDLYGKAIEFAKSIPDYSLLQYRHIIDLMLTQIADKYDVVFTTSDLITRIDTLFDSQLINNSTKDSFHQVRILGNKGAHIEREKPQQEDATLKKAEHKGKMIQLVEQGRKLLISIFEDVLRLNDDSIRIGKVVMMELSIQEFQHVVAQGILTNDFESKMKAALLVDNAANEQAQSSGIVVSSNELAHGESMHAIAMNLFDACCTLSADITLEKEVYGELEGKSKEEYIQKHADLEALFKYALTADMVTDANEEKKVARVKAAAERGFEPAQLFYAEELYFNQSKYDEALKYFEMGIDGVEPGVYLSLFQFYKDKNNPHHDLEEAFTYLHRAVNEGARSAKATLAGEYFSGEYLPVDIDLAFSLAEEAAREGCIKGIMLYRILELHTLAKHYEEMEPIKKINPHTKQPKLGPNEECHCGSKKKFKKCCKGKPPRPLPHELFY